MRTYAPFSCNPFRIRTYKKQRDGGRGLFWLRGSPLNICRSPQYSSSFFSHSCALFCAHQKLNPFLFKRFRTLCQKPPGVGGGVRRPSLHFSRLLGLRGQTRPNRQSPLSPVSTFHRRSKVPTLSGLST